MIEFDSMKLSYFELNRTEFNKIEQYRIQYNGIEGIRFDKAELN